MSNKKIALIVLVFLIAVFAIIALMALFSHLPILGRFIGGFFASLLVVFVITFFVVVNRNKK